MAKEGETTRVPASVLKDFCVEVLKRVEVPQEEAEIMADTLVQADLRGVESHGMVRLPIYVKRIRTKAMAPRANIKVLREGPSTLLIDGGNGMGQVVSVKAMELCIQKAKSSSLAVVGIRNSNHSGAMAYFAMMALKHDMIGICMTMGGKNIMAPWGGITPLLGNNPFAIAVPADKELPLVFDMACSVVARGKIVLAAKKGEKIPQGWAINKYGEPTQDPKEALEGLVLPIGGYKGSGLTIVVAILSGVLMGAAIGREVGDFYGDFSKPPNVGHMVGALAIDSFLPVEDFKKRMDGFVRELKASALAKGTDRIYMPGEIEFEMERERSKNGIPVNLAIRKELYALGSELGVRVDF